MTSSHPALAARSDRGTTEMPGPFTADAQIGRIRRGLVDRTLPKAEWTHGAHLTVALWITVSRPDLVPARDLPGIIRAYNEATGVPNTDTSGYHETITQANLRAVAAFVAALPVGTQLYEACNRLLVSPLADKRWLLAHWSERVLFSPAARRGWVEPDLAPLAF